MGKTCVYCINHQSLLELANAGRPLFPGNDVDDQLKRIFKYPCQTLVSLERKPSQVLDTGLKWLWHFSWVFFSIENCLLKWRVSRENGPVPGYKNWQIFGLQNCVKFVLFQVQSYIFVTKITRNSWNIPSVWYTWQHHGRICTALWTLKRSIFPQHSSNGHIVPQEDRIFPWIGLEYSLEKVWKLFE